MPEGGRAIGWVLAASALTCSAGASPSTPILDLRGPIPSVLDRDLRTGRVLDDCPFQKAMLGRLADMGGGLTNKCGEGVTGFRVVRDGVVRWRTRRPDSRRPLLGSFVWRGSIR